MKPIKSILVLGLLLAPAVASAQGRYPGPPPVPGGFHNRAGRLTMGGSVGLGIMNDGGDRVACQSCDFNPASLELDAHIGGMVNPRLAVLFEAQLNGQTVDSDFISDTTLYQTALMGAVQYWVTPIIWIKGGLGLSLLEVDRQFYDYDGTTEASPQGEGLALMAAAGVELLSARNFALDLQGRVIDGSYGSADERVTGLSIGLGVNWY